MRITSIELDKDMDYHIRDMIKEYHQKYLRRPTTIIISKPLMEWLQKVLMDKCKYQNQDAWKEELNCKLMTFEGLKIIETMRENIIEVY